MPFRHPLLVALQPVGDDEAALDALDRIVRAATAAGATRVSLQLVRVH